MTSRYSRGHYVPGTSSAWLYRYQPGRTYRHYYDYYGRDSRYYFACGRWLPLPPGHIHGPGCGHVFSYGRWMAIGAVAYPVYEPIPVYGYYYYDGGWYDVPPPYFEEEMVVAPGEEEVIEPQPEPVVEQTPILTKGERESVLITRTYNLDWWQTKRVEDLISKGIIESVLAGGEAGESSRLVYDKRKQKLTIAASPDDVMKIWTIIDDDQTYKFFTEEDLGGLVVDAVPLVDLRLLEKDHTAALRIAADNYAGADQVLRSSETAPSGREWWFNDRLGSMTVKNSAENVDAVYEFLETRPYYQPEGQVQAGAL